MLIMGSKVKREANTFDAIQMMRKIRDEISLEIMDMTYEEEKAYLEKLLAEGSQNPNSI